MKYRVMLAVHVEAESETQACDAAFRLLFGERGKPEDDVFYWYQVEGEHEVECAS